MKYIIELDDNQLLEYDKNTDTYFRTLYKVKGFNALVFDKNGLDKLTPLDKELEEAYKQGKHDAEQDLARAAHDEAYQKGFEAGSHEATTLEYQQGLDDAWKAARKICNEPQDGGLPASAVVELFGRNGSILGCSAQNAINKIKAYEEQQKADSEIKVGDEVTPKSNNSNWLGVVVGVDDTNAMVMTRDGYTAMYRLEILKKTDKHFPQMAELLNAMKEGAE